MCCGLGSSREAVASIKPYAERSCTDRLFLVAFLAFWGGTCYIAYLAMGPNGGDPDRLVHGTNLEGDVCGISSAVLDKPYAAWPFPAAYTATICVASCADTASDTAHMAIRYPSVAFGSYCIPDVEGLANSTLLAIMQLSPEFESGANTLIRAVGDLQTAYPVEAGSLGAALVVSFLYLLLLRHVAGLMVWGLIGFLVVCGAVGGWTLLDRADALAADSPSSKDAEWLRGVAYALLALTCVFALLVFALRDKIAVAVGVMKEGARAVAHMPLLAVFPVLTFVVLIAYFVFWLAVALYIYSVADAVTVPTPTPVLVDFFDGSALANSASMVTYEWQSAFRTTFAVHFFGLLWNVEFLLFANYFIVAGTVADWYFTPRGAPTNSDGGANSAAASMRSRRRPASNAPAAAAAAPAPTTAGPTHHIAWSGEGAAVTNGAKYAAPTASPGEADDKRSYSRTPIWDSVKRTLRFHTGTIALGALLMAIVLFVRALVKYIEHQTKGKSHALQRALFCCLQCCLKCLECCIDKISKNAFIWCAIWGDAFAPAACGSFALIWRNLGRVAALNLVSSYLLGVGKLFVALTCTLGAALVLTRWPQFATTVQNPFVPCVVVFVLSYAVATQLMSVFEVIVDTVFLCFMVDCEVNGAVAGRVMLASRELQELVGAHAEASRAAAEFDQAGHTPPSK